MHTIGRKGYCEVHKEGIWWCLMQQWRQNENAAFEGCTRDVYTNYIILIYCCVCLTRIYTNWHLYIASCIYTNWSLCSVTFLQVRAKQQRATYIGYTECYVCMLVFTVLCNSLQ